MGCRLDWEAAEHRDAVPFPSPGRLPRRLAFEKTAKQQLNVTKSRRRGKARERVWRAGRKYNVWRLPAAAQWSGIKKTRYLNSEQFLFFPPPSSTLGSEEKCSRQSIFWMFHQETKLPSQLSLPPTPVLLSHIAGTQRGAQKNTTYSFNTHFPHTRVLAVGIFALGVLTCADSKWTFNGWRPRRNAVTLSWRWC